MNTIKIDREILSELLQDVLINYDKTGRSGFSEYSFNELLDQLQEGLLECVKKST